MGNAGFDVFCQEHSLQNGHSKIHSFIQQILIRCLVHNSAGCEKGYSDEKDTLLLNFQHLTEDVTDISVNTVQNNTTESSQRLGVWKKSWSFCSHFHLRRITVPSHIHSH